jgi:hypothetical protein
LAGTAFASVFEWEGTLSLRLLAVPEALEVTGQGVAVVNPEGADLEWARFAGGIIGTDTFLVTDPETQGSGIVAIQLVLALGSGTLRADPDPGFFEPLLAEASLPVGGVVKLCLISESCSSFIPIPLSASGTRGVGIGGLVTYGGDSGVRISVQAAPWTIGTATLFVQSPSGAQFTLLTFGDAHGPLSLTGSTLASTLNGLGGSLSLVTPIAVSLNSPSPGSFSGFARLDVRFIPEPGFTLLLGSGVLGLFVLARVRDRHRDSDSKPDKGNPS